MLRLNAYVKWNINKLGFNVQLMDNFLSAWFKIPQYSL